MSVPRACFSEAALEPTTASSALAANCWPSGVGAGGPPVLLPPPALAPAVDDAPPTDCDFASRASRILVTSWVFEPDTADTADDKHAHLQTPLLPFRIGRHCTHRRRTYGAASRLRRPPSEPSGSLTPDRHHWSPHQHPYLHLHLPSRQLHTNIHIYTNIQACTKTIGTSPSRHARHKKTRRAHSTKCAYTTTPARVPGLAYTTPAGGLASSSASVCTLFPTPMSSARIPPKANEGVA